MAVVAAVWVVAEVAETAVASSIEVEVSKPVNNSYSASPKQFEKLRVMMTSNMNKPLDQDDIAAMEGQLRNCVEQDRRYWRVNDVKIDAIHTARTYEEFADRVAAAHLRPMEKGDYKSKSARSWNMCASKEKNYDE